MIDRSKTSHQLARELLALPDIPVYVLDDHRVVSDPIPALKEPHELDDDQWSPFIVIEADDFDEETFLDLATMRDSSPLGT